MNSGFDSEFQVQSWITTPCVTDPGDSVSFKSFWSRCHGSPTLLQIQVQAEASNFQVSEQVQVPLFGVSGRGLWAALSLAFLGPDSDRVTRRLLPRRRRVSFLQQEHYCHEAKRWILKFFIQKNYPLYRSYSFALTCVKTSGGGSVVVGRKEWLRWRHNEWVRRGGGGGSSSRGSSGAWATQAPVGARGRIHRRATCRKR